MPIDKNVVNLRQLNTLSLILVFGAFIASLFFNGNDIRLFSLVLLLLIGWLLVSGITIYQQGYEIGNPLIPVSLILFWVWLGISIVFSPVFYLSVVNFWWVGIFPLIFLAYSFSPDNNALWKSLFSLVVITGVALALYALYQVLALQDQPRATFYNKNSLAALINLLWFPLFAYLLGSRNKVSFTTNISALFILSLVFAIINSRGALLAFAVSLVFLLVFTARRTEKRHLYLIGLVVVAAFVTANLLLHYTPHAADTGMVDRLLTLQNTQSAGHSRFVIWQPAWDLFLQHPWTGIGLGTYFLAIPPTLYVNDHSAGFYVHNDYLQIALETGLPGLLLLLLILAATTTRLIKTLQHSRKDDPQRLYFVALFAALLTLAIHSGFTYNLYLLPIMLIAGLFLGRFNQLADQLDDRPLLALQPSRQFQPAVYYLALILLSVGLGSYFISIGVAHHYQHKAYQLAANNQLERAHHAFYIAQKLASHVDSAYYADADLLRKSALVLADRPELARGLLDEAKQLLNRAEELNPLRAQIPYIRGLVLEQASPEKQADIIAAYRAALKRNPRFIPARLALAQYLLEHDKNDETYELLREGLGYSYRQISPAYLELISMTRALVLEMGNNELANRLEQAQQDYARMRSRPQQQQVLNPY